ncbi:FecR family protein [Sunxiuqinia rutila]|uniref:FecR family protein n=1 Tax=Sunxiuqinia rutila TaxID=1397841 RepID=UPI003D35CBCD
MKNKLYIGKQFKCLLDKYKKDDLSTSEFLELQELVKDKTTSSEIEDRMYEELETNEFRKLVTFDKDKLFRSVESKLDEKQHHLQKQRIRTLFWLIPAAASFVLLFVVGGLITYFINENKVLENHLVSSYEIVAPSDAKTQVILPDGSVVWLNEGSKLTYSAGFNLDNRLVYLEGEGYFQVAKNKQQPFVVDAYGLLIEGGEIEFNVKAYQDEPTITAILVEGKAWVNHRTEMITSDVSLGRKYKATFYKQPGKAILSHRQPRLVISPNVDPKPLVSWKNDQIMYKKIDLLEKIIDQGREDLVILHMPKTECRF